MTQPSSHPTSAPGYAELHCLSSFSFLRSASQPQELAERADALGYDALALTDECSVAGVVRAHTALKGRRTRLIIGAEFRLGCGLPLVLLAADRRGYGQLCRLITRGRRAAPSSRAPMSCRSSNPVIVSRSGRRARRILRWRAVLPLSPPIPRQTPRPTRRRSGYARIFRVRPGSLPNCCAMAQSGRIWRRSRRSVRRTTCRSWRPVRSACICGRGVGCTMR
jgi:hypothetical protein